MVAVGVTVTCCPLTLRHGSCCGPPWVRGVGGRGCRVAVTDTGTVRSHCHNKERSLQQGRHAVEPCINSHSLPPVRGLPPAPKY